MKRIHGALAALVLSLVPAGAAAAPGDSVASGRAPADSFEDWTFLALARAEYERGVDAYRHGRFADAIRSFSRAELFVPSAALSFDMARAYEKLDDLPGAALCYRDYLSRAGFIPDRAEIERRIARLDRAWRDQVRRLGAFTVSRGSSVLDIRRASPRAHAIGRRSPGVGPGAAERAPSRASHARAE